MAEKKKKDSARAWEEVLGGAGMELMSGPIAGIVANSGGHSRKPLFTKEAAKGYSEHLQNVLKKLDVDEGAKKALRVEGGPTAYAPDVWENPPEIRGKALVGKRGLGGALHELGHREQDIEGSSISKMKTAADRVRLYGGPGIGYLGEKATHAIEPLHEADAWRRALKMAESKPALRKLMIKQMIPTLGSYATRSALSLGGLGLGALGTYHLMKGDE